MSVFVLTMVSGPAWDTGRVRREQEGWDEHAAFMDRLVDDGFVVLGGPLGDGDRVMVVVDARDDRNVDERIRDDPWLISGVLSVDTIEPWTIWLDGRDRSG